MDVADVIPWNAVFAFKECGVVEIQVQCLLVQREHLFSESFLIVEGVDPSVESVFHLECAVADSIGDIVKWSIEVGVSESRVVFIDIRQVHIQYVEYFLSVQFAQMSFKIAPKMILAPFGAFCDTAVVFPRKIHAAEDTFRTLEASAQGFLSEVQVECGYDVGFDPQKIFSEISVLRFRTVI